MKSYQFVRQVEIPFAGGHHQKHVSTGVVFEGGRHTGVPMPIVDLGNGVSMSPCAVPVIFEGSPGVFLKMDEWSFHDLTLGVALPLIVRGTDDPLPVISDLIRRYKARGRDLGPQAAWEWMSAEASKFSGATVSADNFLVIECAVNAPADAPADAVTAPRT